jgi:hypothetical protein
MRTAILWGAVLLCSACGNKEEGLKAVADVEAACKEGRDKGLELGRERYGQNETFKKAVDAATAEVADKEKVNYCSPLLLIDVRSRIEN